MLLLTKWILLTLYAATPVAAAGRALWRRRRGRPSGVATLSSTAGTAFALGAALNFAYAIVSGASVRFGQIPVTSYFLMALLLLLRGFNAAVEEGAVRLFRLRTRTTRARANAAVLIRVLLLFGVGLPLVMASIMVYRPKVHLRDDPQQQLGVAFETVTFDSRDGITLEGWWIPAVDRFGRPASNVDETVLVCHGLGANKSNQLTLGAHFVQAGFNVLIFDFRAHGHSGGQLSSFGDLERRDVLAAVKWLKDQRPTAARRVYGVGASMGAAALIAAAAEDSDEARAIDAIAVYGTYDSLGELSRDIASDRFYPPMNWLVQYLAVPLASAHAGTNLTGFAPAGRIDHVAPRPVLIIHGRPRPGQNDGDKIIPFPRGEALYDAASQPKYKLWIPGGDHNHIINDQGIGRMVAEFFRTAQAVL
jgi:fermentation-respiration switch protein FrsA (DUF1100 family)